MQKNKKRTIGWKETLSFPDLGLKNLEAKIDTGAYTSVLHCQKVEIIKIKRKKMLRFILLDPGHPSYSGIELILPFQKERKVKNSFGQEENRFIIKTRASMFGKIFEIELSLRDRGNMEFPVLLGRKALRKRFVVDVSKADQSKKLLQRRKKNKNENRNSIKKQNSVLNTKTHRGGASTRS